MANLRLRGMSKARSDAAYVARTSLAGAEIDPTGTVPGAYTSMASLMAAASAGTRVRVHGWLTHSAAGQHDITHDNMKFDWQGNGIDNTATAGTDVITSGIPVGSNGLVKGLKFKDFGGMTRTGTGKGGKAFNFHGAQQWDIDCEGATVFSHSVIAYFDATPGSSGNCFHNKLRRARGESCDLGVQNLGAANDNTVAEMLLYNCIKGLSATSGMSLNLPNFRSEKLDAGLAAASVAFMDMSMNGISGDFHIECQSENPIYNFNGRGLSINGMNSYNDVSGTVAAFGANADDYDILLPQNRYRSGLVVQAKTTDTTGGDKFVLAAPRYTKWRIRTVHMQPDSAWPYTDASNRWSLPVNDYNGNALVGAALTTFVPTGAIGITGMQFAGTPYDLAVGHELVFEPAKVGTIGTAWRANIQVKYDEIA